MPRSSRPDVPDSTRAVDTAPRMHLSRRRFLRWSLVAGVGALIGGARVSTYRHRVEHHDVGMVGLGRPLDAAWLCDFHYGQFIREGSVAAWIDATLELTPDLVLLGGDMVDALTPRQHGPLLDQVARLRAPLGVFAIWGNHDTVRFRSERPRFEAALLDRGITVLHNRGVLVRDDLYLAGLDDLRTGRPDLRAALADRPARTPCLLLSHNPDVLPQVPTDVDLTLCGHTHGGQVRLPWIGPIVTSSLYGRRFVEGWVEAPARGYVSRGLGVTQVPIRINCPPEITSLTLRPA